VTGTTWLVRLLGDRHAARLGWVVSIPAMAAMRQGELPGGAAGRILLSTESADGEPTEQPS